MKIILPYFQKSVNHFQKNPVIFLTTGMRDGIIHIYQTDDEDEYFRTSAEREHPEGGKGQAEAEGMDFTRAD